MPIKTTTMRGAMLPSTLTKSKSNPEPVKLKRHFSTRRRARHLFGLALTATLVASCGDPKTDPQDQGSDPTRSEHHNDDISGENAQSVVRVMQSLNTSTHDILDGIILNDIDRIETASYAIAHHDPVTKEDLDTLFVRLGSRKNAFVACDMGVHNAAVTLNDISKNGEMDEIAGAYAALIGAVATCHRDFKPPASHQKK